MPSKPLSLLACYWLNVNYFLQPRDAEPGAAAASADCDQPGGGSAGHRFQRASCCSGQHSRNLSPQKNLCFFYQICRHDGDKQVKKFDSFNFLKLHKQTIFMFYKCIAYFLGNRKYLKFGATFLTFLLFTKL